jgi:AraC family transcriptional regulator
MQMIQPEQEWRRPPEPKMLASGKTSQVVLARWSASDMTQPLECFSDHADDCHVVSLAVRRTTGELVVGRRSLRAGSIPAGTTFVAGPIPQPCSSVFFEGFDFLQIYLSPELMDECFEEAYGRAPNSDVSAFAPHFTSDGRIRALARVLASVDPLGGALGLAFVDSIGLGLATLLLGVGGDAAPVGGAVKRAPLAKWRLNRTLEYIEANLHKSLSLAQLARVAGLSRMHFAAQFRIATGRPPHAYILSRKVARAQQLLRDNALTIGQVAMELDFSSSAHFAEVFKNQVGETPSSWRRRQNT